MFIGKHKTLVNLDNVLWVELWDYRAATTSLSTASMSFFEGITKPRYAVRAAMKTPMIEVRFNAKFHKKKGSVFQHDTQKAAEPLRVVLLETDNYDEASAYMGAIQTGRAK